MGVTGGIVRTRQYFFKRNWALRALIGVLALRRSKISNIGGMQKWRLVPDQQRQAAGPYRQSASVWIVFLFEVVSAFVNRRLWQASSQPALWLILEGLFKVGAHCKVLFLLKATQDSKDLNDLEALRNSEEGDETPEKNPDAGDANANIVFVTLEDLILFH